MALPFDLPVAAPAPVSVPNTKKSPPIQLDLFGNPVNPDLLDSKTVQVQAHTRRGGVQVSAFSRTISTKKTKPAKAATAKVNKKSSRKRSNTKSTKSTKLKFEDHHDKDQRSAMIAEFLANNARIFGKK